MSAEGQPYTPTTEDVRETYYSAPGVIEWEATRAAAFDRWLAQHDTEVRRAARKPQTTRCGHDSGNLTRQRTPVVCDRVQGHQGSHSYNGRWIWG